MFPINDEDFEDVTIAKVEPTDSGWMVERSDGWSIHIPAESPVTPYVGMQARFYSKGIGYAVRGIFLGGEKVFYRTENEEREYRQKENYGTDATDWLARWDSGRSVWSIEMGGLGPGYEQAIQITVAELVRIMLANKYDHSRWSEDSAWKDDRATIRTAAFTCEAISNLGLSGAQFGAALSLASRIYMDGPIKVMNTESIKDRRIQVSKHFPGARQ